MVINTTIFSHRIVHWVYNYMFRPCILAIFRLYYSTVQSYSNGWHGMAMPPVAVR